MFEVWQLYGQFLIIIVFCCSFEQIRDGAKQWQGCIRYLKSCCEGIWNRWEDAKNQKYWYSYHVCDFGCFVFPSVVGFITINCIKMLEIIYSYELDKIKLGFLNKMKILLGTIYSYIIRKMITEKMIIFYIKC